MRLFELLLILINIPFVLWGFIPQDRPKWTAVFPMLSVLLIGVHLVAEGYRWQMFPAYLLTLILAMIGTRPFLFDRSAKRPFVIFSSILLVLLLIVAAALPTLLPVPQLPDTTGPYAVGTTTLALVDEARPELYSNDPNDRRELVLQIWYPANPTGSEPEAVYLPDLEIAGPIIAERFGLPAFLFSHVNLTPLHIRQDAHILENEAPFPVILFSHGLNSIRMQSTTIVRELASHGYVVAAVDHTFATALTVFPDGRVIFYDAERLFTNGKSNPEEANQLVKQWADDLGFMLDQLELWQAETGNRFNGRLDLSRVGIFGHSTGGGATIEFCMKDGRCDAGVALDSWVLPVSDSVLTDGPTQPFMFINTPRWLGEENAAQGMRIFESLPNDAYNLALAGTQHYDFTDLVLFSPMTPQLGLSGTIDSQYSLSIQNAYILTFFEQYLKMVETPLLQSPSPYSEVQMTVHTSK